MGSFGWQPAPYSPPAVTPKGVSSEDGFLWGFQAMALGSPLGVVDPDTQGATSGPGATWQATVGACQRIVPPAGGPGTTYGLSLITAAGGQNPQVQNAMLFPIAPALALKMATAGGAANNIPNLYVDGWFYGVPQDAGLAVYLQLLDSGLAVINTAVWSSVWQPGPADSWQHVNGALTYSDYGNPTWPNGPAVNVNARFGRLLFQGEFGSGDNAQQGVLAQMRVSQPSFTAAPAMSVTIGPGTYRVAGQSQYQPGEVIDIAAANASNPRIDLVSWDWTSQSLVYTEGTAAAAPVAPPTPIGAALVCQVSVPAAAGSITAADLTDKRQRPGLYLGPAGDAHVGPMEVTAAGDVDWPAVTRGVNVAVASAATTLAVAGLSEPDTSYGVQVSTSWATTVTVTGKTTAGFTLTFGTAAPAAETVDWLLYR